MEQKIMQTKTDNAAEVGQHVFERSGCGVGPFRVIGVFSDVGPHRYPQADGTTIEIGSPGQAMGVCAHCGTGIADCYKIQDANGKTFVVGSTCVYKTGDDGLIRSYKANREVRAFAAAKRDRLAARKADELTALIAANRDALAGMASPNSTANLLQYLERVVPMCGAAGRARFLKSTKCRLAAG
jgi:hypothetical protein